MTLRTAVIMKTDISNSTPRFRTLLAADLQALLGEHHAFLARHAAAAQGRIIKPAGDGFWLEFPSVTAAAQAAMAMQEELRLAQPNRGDDRLAMRIVIVLGDVAPEGDDLVGDALALAARIETVTPPDEIYLSAAARLAVNQAEVRTAPVDSFVLKGFSEPVPVHRVEQRHRTRVIENEFVLITDLRGFSRGAETTDIAAIERVLDALHELIGGVARACDGTVRFSAGDSYCLTFTAAQQAMTAAEQLREGWAARDRQQALGCALNMALHQGVLYAFRSYFFGRGVEIASQLESAASALLAPGEGGIFVTGAVRAHLAQTAWHNRLLPVAVQLRRGPPGGIEVYRLA